MNHYPVLVFRVSQERETTSSPYVHDEFFRGQGQVGYKVSVRNEWLAILPYIRKSQRHSPDTCYFYVLPVNMCSCDNRAATRWTHTLSHCCATVCCGH